MERMNVTRTPAAIRLQRAHSRGEVDANQLAEDMKAAAVAGDWSKVGDLAATLLLHMKGTQGRQPC